MNNAQRAKRSKREALIIVTAFAYGVFAFRRGTPAWAAGAAELWVIGFVVVSFCGMARDVWRGLRPGPKVDVKIVRKVDK